jgi:endonuclease YncB( thermonuclease family)
MISQSIRTLLCAIALFGISLSATAAKLEGRVIGVSDGDTITVLVGEHDSVKVRLAGIDAPKKAQLFGSVSKKNLSNHVYEKKVTVEWEKKDRYGRVLGRVLVDGSDACLEQIRAGLAWHYKQYAKDQSASLRLAYEEAERLARQSRAGLWREPNPIPPWEFRHTDRARGEK